MAAPARPRAAWVATVLALTAGVAHAQIYVCKDANGRTITADRPIAECADRAMRELDRNGVTRREIAAPLTPQQRREREAQEEKQRAAEAILEKQRLYDRALTTRYRNEADIALARKQAIELLDDQMRIDTNALAREMTEMKAAQAGVAATPKVAGNTTVRRRLEDASRAVERRLASIEQRNVDIERMHQKFDAAVKRFREIQDIADAGGSKPLPAASPARPR